MYQPDSLTSVYLYHSSFSNVELPYCWRFYRPIIEPPDISGLPGTPLRHESDPVISGLIESCHTPFSVGPSSGILHAGEVKTFVFQFLTEKVTVHIIGSYRMIVTYHISIYLSLSLSLYIYIYIYISLSVLVLCMCVYVRKNLIY